MHRILHVAALPFPTHQGTQVYLRELCEQQAGRHEVHLVTYAHGLGHGDWAFEHWRAPDRPRHRSLRSGPSWQKPLLDLGLAVTVRSVARQVRPDVVHAHHYEGLAAALAAGTGVPVVYHAHTLLEPELPTYYSSRGVQSMVSVAGLAADRLLPRMAHHCIAISPYLREALVAHGVEEETVTYVPPALSPCMSGTEPDADPDEYSLIYLGNLDRYQGIEGMLRGFARVREHHPEARLRIVTDSEPTRCLELASELGIDASMSVEPHGDFSTVVPRLRASRVALVPRTIPGGFPIKLLNYLEAGVPVVASTHGSGGLRHAVEAMVYSSPSELVACVCALIEDADVAREIGERGRAFAAEHFSWKTSLDVMDAVYDRLLRRRSSIFRVWRRTGAPGRWHAVQRPR